MTSFLDMGPIGLFGLVWLVGCRFQCMQCCQVSSHVPGVTEGSDSCLTGSFVVSCLQADVTLVGAQLLVGEFALVLLGHFRAQPRSRVFRMFLRLLAKTQLFTLG